MHVHTCPLTALVLQTWAALEAKQGDFDKARHLYLQGCSICPRCPLICIASLWASVTVTAAIFLCWPSIRAEMYETCFDQTEKPCVAICQCSSLTVCVTPSRQPISQTSCPVAVYVTCSLADSVQPAASTCNVSCQQGTPSSVEQNLTAGLTGKRPIVKLQGHLAIMAYASKGVKLNAIIATSSSAEVNARL